MKKTSIIAIGALVVAGLFLTSAVFAFGGNNKDGFKVNGEHYNLNIIGKERHADVGDSSGHTMFVLENGHTKIIMTQNKTGEGVFNVTDRNGLDGRAEFDIAPGHYNVYATALGKPGGKGVDRKVNITANANFSDLLTGEKLVLLGYVNINRTKGKPTSVNINELFYVDVNVTVCTAWEDDVCVAWETIEYEDFWVFDIDELLEYYWGYNNEGLKLLQVRFYECTLIDPADYPEGDYPKDYCRWGDVDATPIESKRNGEVIAD